MGMVEGHGALEKEQESGGECRVSKLGWSMAIGLMGPLKRKRTLVGRVMVSKWEWSMAIGPLESKGEFDWAGQGV